MEDLLHDRVASMDVAALTRLLQDRPDVLRGPEPEEVDELVDLLVHPRGVAAALQSSPLPVLHLVEAAVALGGAPTEDELAALLDAAERSPATQRQAVRHIVDDLEARAIAVREGKQIVFTPAVTAMFDPPLRLGPPAAVLLEHTSVPEMGALLRGLGLPTGGKRQDVVERLLAAFADRQLLTQLLAAAPPAVRAVLADPNRDDDPRAVDYNHYIVRRDAVLWAVGAGLAIERRYNFQIDVPAEVTLAARGEHYRAPFQPEPPAVGPRQKIAKTDVERDAAAAATAFAAQLLAVLDHVARANVATLRTGGVGTRELTKLAKACGMDEFDVRLALELAYALGLLDDLADILRPSEDFAAWRDADPGAQLAGAIGAWWGLGRSPGEARDDDGKALRVLAHRPFCGGCQAARLELLATAEASGPREPAELAALTLWRRPLLHVLTQDAERPLDTVRREATALGVLARGAITVLGRALRAGDDDALLAAARRMLPAATARATFGSDLTAYVAGTPTAQVSTLLDSTADRESRGGAITWRFSTGSVRRALDDGARGDELVSQLEEIADTELPQALSYLIGDVARRHGVLRLSGAGSIVRSDDTALLAIVAADRALAKLGVRLVAPTVLAADVPLATLLQTLRKAGYFPAVDDAPATPPRPGVAPAPAPTPPADRSRILGAPPPTLDAAEVAAHLRSSRRRSTKPASATERILTGLVEGLSRSEIRQLAHALDTGTRVGIDYVSTTGARTSRVIDRPELAAGAIFAWCELRRDDRVFTVSRIVGVTPA